MAENTPEAKTHRIVLTPSGSKGDVPHGITVLSAARELGVDIESICAGRQTCGKCQIELQTGDFQKHGIHSRKAHLSPPDDGERNYAAAHGIDLTQRRLSCTARILGDVLIHIPEESRARKQVIRKEASDLRMDVNPAVGLHYVEVEPAVLGGPSDWERLAAALKAEWDLPELGFDPVLLRSLPATLRQEGGAVTATIWGGREVIRLAPGYNEGLYGFAVDVGSTTVAGYLCDLRTGEVLATEAMMNPQIRFGEDLMSRVSYAMSETAGTQRMQRAILRGLDELAEKACEAAGIQSDEITDMTLVGNTVMHHLLLGINPVELGGAPFALAQREGIDIRARDLGLNSLHEGARAYILPCIAGHVGADCVGVLLAERPLLDEKISLLVDIGTNAEILLGNREELYSASSPTGPAFEGAQITHGQRAAPGAIERVRIDKESGRVRYRVVGDERWNDELAETESLEATGICGSGIIEVVGELLRVGWIDATGRFVEAAHAERSALRKKGRTIELILARADETATGREIVVTQNDVRAIQLAKGALYAGARLLMEEMGVEQVDRIRLAGAFGNYIDPEYAMIIGMIPDCDLRRVSGIGNAAGDGARIALLNVEQREVAERASRSVNYVETAVNPRFQDRFVGAMSLPHSSDPFPHLEGILPATRPKQGGARRHRGKGRRTAAGRARESEQPASQQEKSVID
jgi:uncharacterized 2Fe-2S/4Fe-4S cluster protein (DUF4445 family)